MLPLVALSVVLAAPVPKAPEKVEAKLDGVWVLTARESNGRPVNTVDTLKASYTLIVVGNEYVFRSHSGTIKLDKEKKTIELAVTAGTYKGETSGGVFERDGNKLRIAMPLIPRTTAAKPTELASTPGTTHTLFTFELDKDASEKAADKLKERVSALPNRANPFNPVAPLPLPAPAPALPVRPNPAAQLQEALDRIEKLEKRVQELEKEKAKKDEKK